MEDEASSSRRPTPVDADSDIFDVDLFDPTPVKRDRTSPSTSPQRPAKRVKCEVEDAEEVEQEEDNSSEESSRPPSPRVRHKRECAEAAKKKIKTEVKPDEGKADAPESREGSCERSDCPLKKSCCLSISESCINTFVDASGKLFHHLSKSEHVCHICYDLLWKPGQKFTQRFLEWKTRWTEESRCNPCLKAFILDQILPYWISCSKCHRYRKLTSEVVLSSSYVRDFTCEESCEEPESGSISDARQLMWILSIAASPLLQNSPCLHYLKGGHYFYDELGMSPVECRYDDAECASSEFMSPFNIPDQQSKAFCLRPDVMEYDEALSFPEYSVEPVLYLAIRNLIVTLWNLNPFQYLRVEDCVPHLICRGLARVWYVQEMGRVFEYLRVKNIINYGILDIPKTVRVKGSKPPLEVVIVGAGISGLAAARQLRALGASVKVLEAKGHIGGRMQDDWSLGVAVGCGAQLVTGSINNPIILMCEQTGVGYRIMDGPCPLIDGQVGKIVDTKVDKYVEEHFDCILDALFHWKNSTKDHDASLAGPLGGLAGTIKSLIGPQDGLSMIDLGIVAIACVLGTYFVTIKVLAPAAVNEVECNSTLLHTARNGSDGWTELDVAVVTDLDHDSRHVEKKNTWQSIIKKGTLRLSPKADQASVVWHDEEDYIVSSQISAGGRAMELSDLCVFNGKLLTADDRTGIVYEIKDEKVIPWLLLNDGPGNVTKGLKAEWMTVKDKHLYVGGLGKEWTTTTGEYVNDHPMWVKVVSPSGAIQHVSWYDVFVKVRRAIGIEYPGYMIHEAVQWSAIHKEWFFLPRRASKEVYTEVDDEHRGASVMIVADESFSKFRAVHIGKHDNPSRGYSALQFVPGTDDRVIVALKSEEKDGKPVASYLTVFDVKGKVILPDTQLLGAHKYEGIAFV